MTVEPLHLRVRAARKELGLTQVQIADQAGISERAYQDFETGKRMPQTQNLRAILAAVGMTFEGDVSEIAGEQWPQDVAVFLDMIGIYLVSLSEADRLRVIRDVTRGLFGRSPQT